MSQVLVSWDLMLDLLHSMGCDQPACVEETLVLASRVIREQMKDINELRLKVREFERKEYACQKKAEVL